MLSKATVYAGPNVSCQGCRRVFWSHVGSILCAVVCSGKRDFFFPTGASNWLLLLNNKQDCFMWLYDPIMITYRVLIHQKKIKIQSFDYN